MNHDNVTAWWTRLSPEDKAEALEFYDERAAIFQYLGELSRAEAESKASELTRERYGNVDR